MIRSKKEKTGPVIIDLTGPDGNAYALIAYARNFGRQLKWDEKRIDALIEDMKSSDYDYLLQTFDNAFGEYVILEF